MSNAPGTRSWLLIDADTSHESEAKLLCEAKDKNLHRVYKGLSHNVVKEAFDWNDNYVTP